MTKPIFNGVANKLRHLMKKDIEGWNDEVRVSAATLVLSNLNDLMDDPNFEPSEREINEIEQHLKVLVDKSSRCGYYPLDQQRVLAKMIIEEDLPELRLHAKQRQQENGL